jgi:hypothetical protein
MAVMMFDDLETVNPDDCKPRFLVVTSNVARIFLKILSSSSTQDLATKYNFKWGVVKDTENQLCMVFATPEDMTAFLLTF